MFFLHLEQKPFNSLSVRLRSSRCAGKMKLPLGFLYFTAPIFLAAAVLFFFRLSELSLSSEWREQAQDIKEKQSVKKRTGQQRGGRGHHVNEEAANM